MGTPKSEEVKKEVGFIFGYSRKPSQKKGQQLFGQAKKQADDEATEILKMVEEKGRLIINEAAVFAQAKAAKILAQAQQEANEIVAKAREQAQSDRSRAIHQNGVKIGQATGEAKNIVNESQLVATTNQTLDKGFSIIVEATRKAEGEANRIIDQAKETGRQIVEEAKRGKEDEAKKIVSQAQENGRQIIEEATKKAENEGNRIVTQALQTGLNIIVEAARIADKEAESIKRISQGEHKEHPSIEEAKAAAVNRLWKSGKYLDLEREGQQLPEEIKYKIFSKILTDQELNSSLLHSRPVAGKAKTTTVVHRSYSPKSILKIVKAKKGPEMKVDVENQTAMYQGQVELAIMPPIDFIQLERLRSSLQKFKNIRILSTDGCRGGSTAISILLNQPSSLITDLNRVEEVEEAFGEETLDSHPLGDSIKKTLPPRTSKNDKRRRILLVMKKTERCRV